MIGCNLKNSALGCKILFQMEAPFILLGMELSLSKRVWCLKSYVDTYLSSPGKMPGIGFHSISLSFPNPTIKNFPITKSNKFKLCRPLEINADFCIHIYSSGLRIRAFIFPKGACKLLTEPFGGRIHVSCSWSTSPISQGAEPFTHESLIGQNTWKCQHSRDLLYLSILWNCFPSSGRKSGIRPVTAIPPHPLSFQ